MNEHWTCEMKTDRMEILPTKFIYIYNSVMTKTRLWKISLHSKFFSSQKYIPIVVHNDATVYSKVFDLITAHLVNRIAWQKKKDVNVNAHKVNVKRAISFIICTKNYSKLVDVFRIDRNFPINILRKAFSIDAYSIFHWCLLAFSFRETVILIREIEHSLKRIVIQLKHLW